MWRELWTEHRRWVLFAIGMFCFLTAGLLTRVLSPGEETPPVAESASRTEAAAEKRRPIPTNPPAANESSSTRRGTGNGASVNGASVLSVRAAAEAAEAIEATENAEPGGGSPGEWFAYVTGSVRNPGVYKLPAGSRLFHLVEAAGGLNNLADPAAVNLAALLEDGVHIHVPRKGERSPESPAAAPSPVPRPRSSSMSPGRAKAGDMIDINRASQEELTSLKGIGPALAGNIVEHRQKNGRFRSVEDLLQVKGIGAKKLEGFRDRLTVSP
ncbi:MAG: ComEA family DNA-binding protein [Synergistaceae bacterium]|jgi:competence protein ComEA|nr:ComEA family DNA-binding protein [Synergistaceae bacterium]